MSDLTVECDILQITLDAIRWHLLMDVFNIIPAMYNTFVHNDCSL